MSDQQTNHPEAELTPIATPQFSEPSPPHEATPKHRPGIAPLWHTIVLVLVILGFSLWGAFRSTTFVVDPILPTDHSSHSIHTAPMQQDVKSSLNRLSHYALSGVFELILVAWVAYGLRLCKTPFRSLLGALPRGLNDITKEAGVSALFWICSMVILASFALTWNSVQTRIYEHQLKNQTQDQHQTKPGQKPSTQLPKLESPRQEQIRMTKKLMQLAPANGVEIAAWGALCLIVGFSEEFVFRGYLQLQSIVILRSLPVGVICSAIIFGAAHGYQGVRGICIITVYGALFSCIALLRRNLFPGMLAHAWHDFFTGMFLAFLRSTNLLDRLPLSN